MARCFELDVPDMRRYFELGGEVEETGRESPLEEVTLRAPIVPKKFFHTAGNFREHHEESKSVNWSHPVLPWIVFFQNVDAIIGPDDAIIYPEALTNELDYELELAVVIGKAGKFFSPEEAADYIAGYLIFNDITARDIQREEMKSGVFCLSKSIDTFCPIGPWIVTPDEIPDPHALSMELRVNGERAAELAHEPDVGDGPRDHQPLLGDGLQRRGHHLDRHGGGRGRLQRRRRVAVPQAGRRGRGRDRGRRRAAQPGHLVERGASATSRRAIRRGGSSLSGPARRA